MITKIANKRCEGGPGSHPRHRPIVKKKTAFLLLFDVHQLCLFSAFSAIFRYFSILKTTALPEDTERQRAPSVGPHAPLPGLALQCLASLRAPVLVSLRRGGEPGGVCKFPGRLRAGPGLRPPIPPFSSLTTRAYHAHTRTPLHPAALAFVPYGTALVRVRVPGPCASSYRPAAGNSFDQQQLRVSCHHQSALRLITCAYKLHASQPQQSASPHRAPRRALCAQSRPSSPVSLPERKKTHRTPNQNKAGLMRPIALT